MINKELLSANARRVTEKIVLAADESDLTGKFSKIGIECNPETRLTYRHDVLLATPLEKFVSGVILFDETWSQKNPERQSIPQMLIQKGIMPGIKVDLGKRKIEGLGEYTIGNDNLDKRLRENYKDAIFTKARSVFTIGPDSPTDGIIEINNSYQALNARISQEAGKVPMSEPETLIDGSHSIDDCKKATTKVLRSLFQKFQTDGIHLSGMILKVNMITPSEDRLEEVTADEVATATLDVLKDIPLEIPVVFLSGGLNPVRATEYLNAINRLRNKNPKLYPPRLTASYGRALQDEARQRWEGKPENVHVAQTIFMARAKRVHDASFGSL